MTLWQPKTKAALLEIERSVGNTFEWSGCPQAADILAGAAANAAEQVREVDPATLPHFLPQARLLAEACGGADKALCAALAALSGYSAAPASRSLLGSSEGYVSFEFHSGKEVPAPGYVFGALLRCEGWGWGFWGLLKCGGF